MSSTRQMPVMTDEVRMRKVRARQREQLRNRVIAETPGLSPEEIEARVTEIQNTWRSQGGRRSQARRAQEIEVARRLLAALPGLIANHEAGLNELRRIAALAEESA